MRKNSKLIIGGELSHFLLNPYWQEAINELIEEDYITAEHWNHNKGRYTYRGYLKDFKQAGSDLIKIYNEPLVIANPKVTW